SNVGCGQRVGVGVGIDRRLGALTLVSTTRRGRREKDDELRSDLRRGPLSARRCGRRPRPGGRHPGPLRRQRQWWIRRVRQPELDGSPADHAGDSDRDPGQRRAESDRRPPLV
ncbi:LOW QUALITY PROTEIN: hypothetical protein OPAG_08265, partial [Rhodococcus opacus PD630]